MKECNNGTALDESLEILLEVERGGGVLKPVLFAGNLTHNYEAAPNYRYIFDPHRGPLLPL